MYYGIAGVLSAVVAAVIIAGSISMAPGPCIATVIGMLLAFVGMRLTVLADDARVASAKQESDARNTL